MSESTLPINSDMVLRFGVLKNRAGTPLTAATVTLQTFKDTLGATVTGITLPLTFTHIADGVYEAAIPDAIEVVANQTYKATVRAVSASLQREWTHTIKAVIGEA